MKKVLNNPLQFLQTDETVIVDVKHFENLFQVVLRGSVGHDVEYNHKFSKIDVAVLEKTDSLGDGCTALAGLWETLLVSYILKM